MIGLIMTNYLRQLIVCGNGIYVKNVTLKKLGQREKSINYFLKI